MDSLQSQIESLLFVSSKPLDAKVLAKLTGATPEAVKKSVLELQENRKTAGVNVIASNGFYQLATNSENSEIVTNFLNSDLREKLTDATVEVLAIIAYRQPISKSEIEAIRGVNSQYSIRHLLMRGLIEKVANPNDARGTLYQVTNECLEQLGIQSIDDLPTFQELTAQIKLPETPLTKHEESEEQNTKAESGDTMAMLENTGLSKEDDTDEEEELFTEEDAIEEDEVEENSERNILTVNTTADTENSETDNEEESDEDEVTDESDTELPGDIAVVVTETPVTDEVLSDDDYDDEDDDDEEEDEKA